MILNIKDPEAHRLAQQIARATGETMTRVVTEALRERLSRLERRNARASVESSWRSPGGPPRISNTHTSTMPNSCTTSMACRDDPGHFRLVAVLYGEPKVRDFIERIRAADICRISVANHVELSMVVESQLGPNGMRQADAFLRRADVVVEPVTIEQGDLSRQAFLDFGKAGTRRA
jgi:hypothetical protein